MRAAVLKELETLRQGGKIGSSLQAEVAIGAPDADYDALASLGDDLRFVLITSAADGRARRAAHRSPSRRARTRSASAAGTTGRTSARDPQHPTLCGRCVANLFGSGSVARFA